MKMFKPAPIGILFHLPPVSSYFHQLIYFMKLELMWWTMRFLNCVCVCLRWRRVISSMLFEHKNLLLTQYTTNMYELWVKGNWNRGRHGTACCHPKWRQVCVLITFFTNTILDREIFFFFAGPTPPPPPPLVQLRK